MDSTIYQPPNVSVMGLSVLSGKMSLRLPAGKSTTKGWAYFVEAFIFTRFELPVYALKLEQKHTNKKQKQQPLIGQLFHGEEIL